MEVLWSSGIVITGCHLTQSLRGPQVGTVRISILQKRKLSLQEVDWKVMIKLRVGGRAKMQILSV